MLPQTVMWATVDGSAPPEYAPLSGGIGIVLSDHDGEYLTISRAVSPQLPIQHIEALAVRMALEVAWELGAVWVTVHTDNSHIIAQVLEVAPLAPGLEDTIRHIQRLRRRFRWCGLVYVHCEENQRADELAREAMQQPWSKVFPDAVRWRGQEVACDHA